jgi:hypothetical protein
MNEVEPPRRELAAIPRPGAARFLPCWLLLGVALSQLWLTQAEGLSPWLGGGFGMFSTTDVGSRRHVHAVARYPGLELELPRPPELADLEERTRALPSEARLRELARAWAPFAPREYGSPRTLVVQVFGTRFDPVSLVPSAALLRQVEVPLARGPD